MKYFSIFFNSIFPVIQHIRRANPLYMAVVALVHKDPMEKVLTTLLGDTCFGRCLVLMLLFQYVRVYCWAMRTYVSIQSSNVMIGTLKQNYKGRYINLNFARAVY